jgi:hypothetical protein
MEKLITNEIAMLFLGFAFGLLLYVLINFSRSKDKNFFKHIAKKKNIVPFLINVVLGSALILAWGYEPGSLKELKIEHVSFLKAMGFGILGELILNGWLLRNR